MTAKVQRFVVTRFGESDLIKDEHGHNVVQYHDPLRVTSAEAKRHGRHWDLEIAWRSERDEKAAGTETHCWKEK